jgi:hypothetical protein
MLQLNTKFGRPRFQPLRGMPMSNQDETTGEIDPKVLAVVHERQKRTLARYSQNFRRVLGLVELHIALQKSGKVAPPGTEEDVLRAAVVFLHASLEDFLRSVASSLLPTASETALNEIPLKSGSRNGRPEKFLLGALTRFRGKSVDQVIRDSVASHLERSNFNDVQEIARLLESLGLQRGIGKDFYSDLAELIERRHQIVHRADVVDDPTGDGADIRPIDPQRILDWLRTFEKFMSEILPEVTVKGLIDDGSILKFGRRR